MASLEVIERNRDNRKVAFVDPQFMIHPNDKAMQKDHAAVKKKVVLQDPAENVKPSMQPPKHSTQRTATEKDTTKDGSSSLIHFQTKTTEQTEKMQKLTCLKELYDGGFITVTEFKERKSQIIDELTGTTTTATATSRSRSSRRIVPHIVVPSPPPDWSEVKEETALKHVFDPITRQWSTSVVKVKVDSTPFACGGLRKCYHLQDQCSGPDEQYVAKLSIDPFEDRDIYFIDVEIQMYSKLYAEKFNQYNPPNKVDFVIAWLLELIERENRPLCGVERFIDGPYRKHNNNFGYVSEDERNTPQAFSHFTYEASNHKILICDIQGVGDLYTDPQMHTIHEEEIGLRCKGNMGARGISKFLSTHQCNAICRYLRLPSNNAKINDAGTVPATTYMSYQKVDVVNVVFPPFDQSAFISNKPDMPLISPEQKKDAKTSRGCLCTIV